MTEQPLVSVIINCYNGEKYLREAIDSVMAQTYQNWEAIVWDNQSIDKTAEIVSQYKDQRIKYFYAQEHVMLGAARNQAMAHAKGDFITFLDYDDLWQPIFLERIMRIFDKVGNDYSFVFSNYYNWKDSKELIVNNQENESGNKDFYSLLKSYTIGMSAVVVRKESLTKRNISFNKNYQLIEDYEFFLKLAYHNKAYYVAEPLMKYRMHSGSLTNTMKRNWGREFQQLYDDLTGSWLTEEEKAQYSSGLRWLKVRIARSDIEKKVGEGHRIEAFAILLKNIGFSYKLWIMMLAFFLPTDIYIKVIHRLRKHDYSC